MSISQKGNSLIFVLVGVLVFALIGGAYYYGKQSSNSSIQSTQTLAISPSPIPVQSLNLSDINNFPVYPNTEYVKSQVNDPCPTGGAGGFAICGTTTYTWSSSDNFTSINDWYKQDKSQSGWKCSGGAGQYSDPDNASGITACVKGSFNYGLNIETTGGHSTITLSIPNKPAISPSPISVPAKKLNYSLPSGWKTVQDPTGVFEVGYDPIKTVLQSSTSNPTGAGLYLYGNWQDNPAKKIGFNYDVGLKPYDGGSRHIFILGSDYATNFEKASSYHEKTYAYNGWSCLVLYGTYVSQSFVTWGMCAISGTQAFDFAFDSENESEVEQIIQTIKLLK